MKTRATSADGANLGHHAEPTLGEDLCAGTVGVGGAISARSKSWGRRGRAYYRRRGLQYIGGSVADSTRRAYESGRRSWDKFCRLMHYEKFLKPSDSEEHKVWVLIEYASWCCEAEGDLAGTISGKLAAVQYFHRLEAGVELPTTAPVLKSALKGIARSHVVAGTPRQVRLPVSWGMLLEGKGLIPSWGAGGKEMWLCLCLSYFLIARSDEMFASDSGVVHPAHRLTRGDVALFAGDAHLAYALWPTADKIKVRVRGHKGDQDMIGSVRVRTRDEITGPRSGYRAGSLHRSLPASAPLSLYNCGKSVRVLRYGHSHSLRSETS